MRKFSIEITPQAVHIPLNDANHQNAIVQHHRQLYTATFDTIRSYASSLKSLTLNDNFFPHVTDYAKLLRPLTNLQTLKLENCRMNNHDPCQTFDLPSLRKLTIRRGSWLIFKVLAGCSRVTDLRIEMYTKESKFMHHYGEFLARNKHLRQLEVFGTARCFVNYADSLRFQLTRLKIDNFYFHDQNEAAKMLELLKARCLDLHELTVCNAPRDSILKCILGDMRKLQRLEIGITLLPESANYFHVLRKQEALRSLVLRGKLRSMDVLRGILQHYPMITSLKLLDSLPDDINDLLVAVSDTHRRLQHLTLPCLPGIISPVINLPSLQSLTVTHLRAPDEALNLTFLVIYSPAIRRLSVENVENAQMSNTSIAQIASKAKELRELSFGKRFELDDQAMNIVKNAAKSLKKFTIFTGDVERMRSMAERIHSDGLNCTVFGVNRSRDDFDAADEKPHAFTSGDTFNSVSCYAEFVRQGERREPRGDMQMREPNMNVARMRRIVRRRYQAVPMHRHHIMLHHQRMRAENGNGNANRDEPMVEDDEEAEMVRLFRGRFGGGNGAQGRRGEDQLVDQYRMRLWQRGGLGGDDDDDDDDDDTSDDEDMEGGGGGGGNRNGRGGRN
jgi:hypothetical protein